LLHELISGVPRFPGDSEFDVATRVVRGDAAPLPGRTDPRLVECIERATAADPDQRYQDAISFSAALAAIQPDVTIELRTSLAAARAEIANLMQALHGQASSSDTAQRQTAPAPSGPQTPASSWLSHLGCENYLAFAVAGARCVVIHAPGWAIALPASVSSCSVGEVDAALLGGLLESPGSAIVLLEADQKVRGSVWHAIMHQLTNRTTALRLLIVRERTATEVATRWPGAELGPWQSSTFRSTLRALHEAANEVAAALLLFRQGQRASATRALWRSRALAPRWTEPLVVLGNVQVGEGEFGRALGTFNLALTLDDDARAHLGRAHCLKERGRPEEAVASLTRAQDLGLAVDDLATGLMANPAFDWDELA
jgi:tetratricopeptide (TPR) repeat protein